MKCQSTRFGSFEISENSLLTFPSGLLGFPDQLRYVILDHDHPAPFKWLQSVDEPSLAFVIMDSADVVDEYSVDIAPEALKEIQADQTDELSLAVILTIPSSDPASVTANLRGPLLFNARTKLCKQLVLSETMPTRHPLFPSQVTSDQSRPEPVQLGSSR